MIDMHLHTIHSDGTDTPVELLKKLIGLGIKTFSFTDHDTLRAYESISLELQKNKSDIRLITGVEVSSIFKGINVHLLCYNFDINDPAVKKMVAEVGSLRRPRTIATLKYLSENHNIDLSTAATEELLSREISGKLLIISSVKNEYRHISNDTLKSYICEMDVCKYRIDARYVIETITNAGGFVALAHPIEVQREYHFDTVQLKVFIQKLKEIGLSAIEVYHSAHNLENIIEYKKIAGELELHIVGGSDFHGYNKEVKIGQLSSCGYTPDHTEIYIPD
jgi:hypothetical protein